MPSIVWRMARRAGPARRGRSEDTDGRLLDTLAQKRVQAVACRDIDAGTESLFEQNLDAGKIQERKPPRGIVLDENIDIAVCFCLAAGDRPEEVQPGRPSARTASRFLRIPSMAAARSMR